jgi:hypothetical protein
VERGLDPVGPEQGPLARSCECRAEISGSGATDLIS